MIKDIQVVCNRRVEPETVRSYLKFSPGQAYSAAKVDASLKALFATGLFADVSIEPQGAIVVVTVRENPVINQVAAEGTAFEPTCLVAPAGEPFPIEFDNRDPVAVTGPHNIAIAVDEEAVASDPIFKGELVNGPETVSYDVPAIQDEGSYFFQCDVHPTMTGTLAVVAAGRAVGTAAVEAAASRHPFPAGSPPGATMRT